MTAEQIPSPFPEGMTLEEYYVWENAQEAKHEFDNGRVRAMAGASADHVRICFNIGGELRNRLKGGPCEGMGSDYRTGFPGKTYTHYADVTVVCGPGEVDSRDTSGQTFLNPTAIFEVLSPSTAGFDQMDKFSRYRQLASFREYVIVRQDEAQVQTFYRRDDSTWLFSTFTGLNAVVPLKSIGIELPLSEIYDRVTFDAPPAGE